MSLPAYPRYKSSGVEWLGDVPDHWGVTRFKWHISRNDGGVWGEDPDGIADTIVLRSTEQTVDGSWQIENPALRKLSEAEKQSSILEEGDLLVTKSSGSSLHIGKTTIVDREVAALECCFSNFMQRIRTKKSLLPKLAWHMMNGELARRQFDLLSNSTTGLANLNGTMIGDLIIPIPTSGEQSRIVSFLDHETAKIDALVGEQQRLIDLLREKRQAVITRAVTMGLSSDVPLRPSGIEWLGDVPEHWRVVPITHLVSYMSYGFTNPMPTDDDGPYMLTANDIDYGRVRYETARRTSRTAFDELLTGKSRPIRGDVLVTKDGTLGRTAVHDGQEVCINQSVALLRPNPQEVTPEFLGLALLAGVFQERMVYEAGGTTIKHIYISRLAKMPLVVPPLGEQMDILGRIEQQTRQLDALMEETVRALALLQERRTSLITAAVTGKIDLRSSGDTSEPTADSWRMEVEA